MLIHTIDPAAINVLENVLTDAQDFANPHDDVRVCRAFVGEDGNLHYSTYSLTTKSREDYVIHLHRVSQ